MGRNKPLLPSDNEKSVSRPGSVKKNTMDEEQHPNSQRPARRSRLRKQVEMDVEAQSPKPASTAKPASRRAEPEAAGRFSWGDQPEQPEKPPGKKASKKQTNLNDFTKSGKSSMNQKESTPTEKKLLQRRKQIEDEEDEFNLLNAELEDMDIYSSSEFSAEDEEPEEDFDGDFDEEFDEKPKKQTRNKPKKGSKPASKPPQPTNTIKTRASANQMDIEVEVVRGKKTPQNSPAGNKQAISSIKPEDPQKESQANKKWMKSVKKSEDSEEEPSGEIKGVLSGNTIVLTGIFDTDPNRDNIIQMIKTLGAKSTTSVSKKTTMLVHGVKLTGEREDFTEGSKYKMAKAKGVNILSEHEFDKFLQQITGYSLKQLVHEDIASEIAKHGLEAVQSGKHLTKPQAEQPKSKHTKMDVESISEDRPTNRNELWADKYAPKTCHQIIGNQGNITKLEHWLRDWDDVVLRGMKKEIKVNSFNPNSFAAENVNARAALLSGSPGIGKTSAVRLLCKKLGLNLIEQNASDMRNKNSVKGTFATLGDNFSLNFAGEVNKSVILMDEVDGMSSDRGGTAALNEYIKKTKVPIICVCNDRQHPKMRTLAGNCYDIKFTKPPKPQVVDAIKAILRKEVGRV